MHGHPDAIAAPQAPALLTLGALRRAQLALAELAPPVPSTAEVTLTRAVGRVLARDLDDAAPTAACLIRAGTRLEPRHLPLFAARGHALAAVRGRPRVGVIALPDARSTASWLAATLERQGLQPFEAACRAPGPQCLRETLEMLVGGCDLVLTAGFLDPASGDAIAQAQARHGGSRGLETVALRPLGALQVARVGATPVVALSPDLASAVVAFTTLLTPLLRRLQGRGDLLPEMHAAELATPQPARWQPFPARRVPRPLDARLRLERCAHADWAQALAAADGLAWQPAEFAGTDASTVAWLPFEAGAP